MISKYSKTPQLVSATSDLGWEEVKQGLSIKNEGIKQGHQAVQSTLDKISSLDVARNIDKDYISAKMNMVVDRLNSYGNIDLSSQENLHELMLLPQSILKDDNIVNAIESTQNMQKVLAQRSAIKTNPKLTHLHQAANEAEEQEEQLKYLNSGKIGDKYLRKTAIIGVDTSKIEGDLIKSIKDRTNTTVNGEYLIETTGKNIGEMTNAFYSTIQSDANYTSQLKRNFNYQFGNNKQGFVDNLKATQKNKIDNINTTLTRLDVDYTNLISQGKKEEAETIKQTIEGYKSLKAELSKPITLDPNSENFMNDGFNLFLKDHVNNLVQSNSGQSTKIKTNNAYFQGIKANLDQQRFSRDLNNDEWDRRMDVQKTNIELEKMRINQIKVLGEFNPSAANAMLSGQSYEQAIQNTTPNEQFITEEVSLGEDFDVRKHIESQKSEYIKDNALLTKDLITTLIENGIYTKEKLNKAYNKGMQIDPNKFVLTPAALNILQQQIENLQKTNGVKYKGVTADIIQKLTQIKENNAAYHAIDESLDVELKRKGINKEIYYAHHPMTIFGEHTQAIEDVNKNMKAMFQKAQASKLIPISNLNEKNVKKGEFATLRQTAFELLKQNGFKIGDELYTIGDYKGLESQRDASSELKNVDWNNSLWNVNPKGKLQFRLVDKEGKQITFKGKNIIDVNVDSNMLEKFVKASNPSLSLQQFQSNQSSVYDRYDGLDDVSANMALQRVGKIQVKGLPHGLNYQIGVKKIGTDYLIELPSGTKFMRKNITEAMNEIALQYNNQYQILKTKHNDKEANNITLTMVNNWFEQNYKK